MTSVYDLFEAAAALDAALTGKSISEAHHNARHQIGLLTDIVGFVSRREAYYLSDSGYSRLVATEDGDIRLTPNSTEKVVAAWHSEVARMAAETFRTHLKAAYAEAADSKSNPAAEGHAMTGPKSSKP